jgi:hypothetical protein
MADTSALTQEDIRQAIQQDTFVRRFSDFGFTEDQVYAAVSGGNVPEIERLRELLLLGRQGRVDIDTLNKTLEAEFNTNLNMASNFVANLDRLSGREDPVEQLQQAQQAIELGQAPPPGIGIDPTTGDLMFMPPDQQTAPATDVGQSIRIGSLDVGQIVANELPLRVDLQNVVSITRAGRVPGPTLMTEVDDAGTARVAGTARPRQMPMGSAPSDRGATVAQAMDWLYSLSVAEVEQLQDRMKAAGYLTQSQYDQQSGQFAMSDMPFERGYADDQSTKQAWVAVIRDALGQGRGVDELLRNQSMEFQRRQERMVQQVTTERQGSFASALGNVRESADQLAIETLGRRLRPEEFVQVRQYLRGLQTERVGQVAGNEIEPWMSQAPETGFTEQELQEAVGEQLVQTEMREPGGNIWSRLRMKYEI